MNIDYRIARLEDLQEIRVMVSSAIDTMCKNNIFQWDNLYPNEEDFKEDIIKKQLYVGTIDGHIASIYVLNQEYDEEYKNGNWKNKDKSFYVIHRLCVNPMFQNKRVGRTTMEHIIDELKNMNIEAIRLDVFSQNPYALKLYTNLGFTKVGQTEWRKGKFYLMEKYL